LTPKVTGIVIDASTALAWCFPDEASEYADGVLVALEDRTGIVPAIWSTELTNADWSASGANESGSRKCGALSSC
jgi:hypothetical protein